MHLSRRFHYSMLSSILLSLVLTPIYAKQPRRFPHGCRALGSKFHHDLLVLENAAEEHPQTLYLVHNLSSGPITLKRKRLDSRDLAPIYKNTIKYDQWGAFATDKPMMYFACFSGDAKEYSYQINCRDVLEICQYTRAKFGEGNMGNYWSVKSNGQRAAMRDAIKQGILLRW